MKKTILVIENDSAIRDIVTYILETEGYRVKGAAHAPVTELQLEKTDLVLLDEWINQKEGHMLCKEIKAIESFRHIPVIIFSTATDIVDIAKNCNADGYVQKPFDIEELICEVRKFLPLTTKPQIV